jgi:hypothetical protein
MAPLATLYTESFENMDHRGTRVADLIAFDEAVESMPQITHWDDRSLRILDKATYKATSSLLQKWGNQRNIPGQALLCAKFSQQERFHGLTFTTQTTSARDSQVAFTVDSGDWKVGSIQALFTAGWESGQKVYTRTFAKIYPYKPLSDIEANVDDYRKFGFSGGRLYHNILDSNQAVVLSLDAISCHFARSLQSHPRIEGQLILALPLNKVGSSLLNFY